jgi:uroporphyrinogen decarboxylase
MITSLSPVRTDWESLVNCIRREKEPSRVHFIELFLDVEVQEALGEHFGLVKDLDPHDPFFIQKRTIRLQRYLGYDYVRCGVENFEVKIDKLVSADTAELSRTGGRQFVDHTRGPITGWDDFERFPWPTETDASARSLEWYQQNLPDDMCIIGSGGFGHFLEHLTWLMGYEKLCFAIYEQRDLVEAISKKLVELNEVMIKLMLQFDKVKIIWSADDMGFKTSTMLAPEDLRALALPGHKRMAELAHGAGRPYLIHSCGKLDEIMPDLIDNVGIDGKHSFEDVIENISDFKKKYGNKIAALGGIDVDFLCRSSESEIRRRVRQTVADCQPGGGFCLGTGNSVANYIPLDNYLLMLDEGRKAGE